MKSYNLPSNFFPCHEVIIEGNKVSILGFDGNLMYEEKTTLQDMEDDEREWVSAVGSYLINSSFLVDINNGLGIIL